MREKTIAIRDLWVFFVTCFFVAILLSLFNRGLIYRHVNLAVESLAVESTAGTDVTWLEAIGAVGIWLLATICLAGLVVRWIVPPRRRNCGCGAVVDDPKWDSEVVETQETWMRDERGAKVIWRNVREELRRCEQCGSHYFADDYEVLVEREAWAEEEPEIMPEEGELMDAEWEGQA